jgi:hypothetical protein
MAIFEGTELKSASPMHPLTTTMLVAPLLEPPSPTSITQTPQPPAVRRPLYVLTVALPLPEERAAR